MRWTSIALAAAAVPCIMAQTAAPAPAAPPAVVVVDAAHGGDDPGAQITERLSEKDVNAQLAGKLRSLLQVRGFDVRLTRDGDPTPSPTANQRAGTANQARAIACVILHSTATGSGVHVYASALSETAQTQTDPIAITKWKQAQQPFVARSLRLSTEMQEAFARANLPVMRGRSWITPLDAMQCPAVVVEIAPLNEGGSTKPPNDEGYQQRVADSIAGVLLAWKNSAAAAVKQ